MKWTLFILMSLSAAVQAQSLTDYQCDNPGMKTAEEVLNSGCYSNAVTKAIDTVHPLAQGRQLKSCYVVTVPGVRDPKGEAKMQKEFGTFGVQFVDYYVNTTHMNEASERYEPQFTNYVVKVSVMTIQSVDKITQCKVKTTAEIVAYPKALQPKPPGTQPKQQPPGPKGFLGV